MMKHLAIATALVFSIGLGICDAGGPPNSLSTVVPKGVTVGGGDVTGDGTVSALDASRALQILTNGRSASVIEYLQADVNFNGRIDRDDATLILRAAVGEIKLPLYQCKPGDVTGNGTVSALDATRLLQYLSNLPIKGTFLVYNADANQDHFIDQRDVDIVFEMAVGKR